MKKSYHKYAASTLDVRISGKSTIFSRLTQINASLFTFFANCDMSAFPFCITNSRSLYLFAKNCSIYRRISSYFLLSNEKSLYICNENYIKFIKTVADGGSSVTQ